MLSYRHDGEKGNAMDINFEQFIAKVKDLIQGKMQIGTVHLQCGDFKVSINGMLNTLYEDKNEVEIELLDDNDNTITIPCTAEISMLEDQENQLVTFLINDKNVSVEITFMTNLL